MGDTCDDNFREFEDECDILDKPCRLTEREYAQMDQIEVVVRNSGMYDTNDTQHIISADIFNFNIDDGRTANQWKNILEETHLKEIEARKVSIHNQDIDNETSESVYNRWNEVVIESMVYIDKNFILKEKVHEEYC